jgi:hypothetical protein
MLLIFAAILMVGIGSCCFMPRYSFSPQRAAGRRRGLRSLVLAIALALVSVPVGAWAKAPDKTSAEIQQTRPTATAPIVPEAGPTQGQDYASREASAKGLEKFEGGDTTVILGGSALVLILLVVLIVVLI